MLKKSKDGKKEQHNNEKLLNEQQQNEEAQGAVETDNKSSSEKVVDKPNIEEQLELALSEKEKVVSEFTDKLQRTLAEFDNYRKRSIKEKTEIYDMGAADTITALLPVIDNFERAINTGISNNSDDAFLKGVEMILRQFKEILTGMDVVEIESIGQKFNPSLHNAVYHVEDDNFSENEIIEDLQKGYMYKNKVIRPSTVKVAN